MWDLPLETCIRLQNMLEKWVNLGSSTCLDQNIAGSVFLGIVKNWNVV